MSVSPYLFFNANCEAAFTFYEQCFGGKIVAMLTHGDSPMAAQVPPEWQKAIIHARLLLGDTALMGADCPGEHYEKPQGFSVAFNTDTPADAERIFHTLAESGTVQMPIEETFWAVRFGMLTDQFGIRWMISCESAT